MSCAVIRTFSPDFRTLPSRMCATLSFSPITRRSSFRPLNWNDEVRPITRSSGSFASRLSSSSDKPIREIFVAGIAAHVDERQHRDRLVAVGLHERLGAPLGARGLGRCLFSLRCQHELVDGEVAEREREHAHDHPIELLAGLWGDRLAAIDLALALQALGRDLERPGEDQRGQQANDQYYDQVRTVVGTRPNTGNSVWATWINSHATARYAAPTRSTLRRRSSPMKAAQPSDARRVGRVVAPCRARCRRRWP